jgi:hypothetical protein
MLFAKEYHVATQSSFSPSIAPKTFGCLDTGLSVGAIDVRKFYWAR